MIHEIMLWKGRYQVQAHFYTYPDHLIPSYFMVDIHVVDVAALVWKQLPKINSITPPEYVISYEDVGTWLIPSYEQANFVAWMLKMEQAGWENLFDQDRRNNEWEPKYRSDDMS